MFLLRLSVDVQQLLCIPFNRRNQITQGYWANVGISRWLNVIVVGGCNVRSSVTKVSGSPTLAQPLQIGGSNVGSRPDNTTLELTIDSNVNSSHPRVNVASIGQNDVVANQRCAI